MTYHMGINLGHERSVALVKDGEIIVAIEQERLDRQKYSLGFMLQAPGVAARIQLPSEAIRYCLDHCGIALEEVASVTPNMPGKDLAPAIAKKVLPECMTSRIHQVPSHHLAHAYSAFWPSGFDQAIVLVADASGSTDAAHQTESYTLYVGQDQQLTPLHSEKVSAHLAGLSTLGFLYEYITRKAGFISHISGTTMSHAEAGKLMGLAPFGHHQPHLHSWIQSQENDYSLKIAAYDIFLEIAALEKLYDTGEGKPYLRGYLVDLAYKVQQELEQALLHIVDVAMGETGLRKLCIAGGIGLNSVANYQLLHQLKLEDIFVFPAAGDGGIAAGCALWAYAQSGGSKRVELTRATLGKPYERENCQQAIEQFHGVINVEQLSAEELLERSAKALSQGHVLARFEGGAEYGPRALGHRSIVVDPTFERMRDILNARVKFREAFRPFAPVIPLESVSDVFKLDHAAPFMLLVPPIRPEFQSQIPAVSHVDGTGRVQTVTAEDNAYFHRLCHRLVELRQGPPVLLNTSFNVAGQPIVETPAEAIQTFLNTDIDYLALENFWISKRDVQVQNYRDHLSKVYETPVPSGHAEAIPAVTELMMQLDEALFWNKTEECPWSMAELKALSTQGGKYKETSLLFPGAPFDSPLQTRLSDDVILLLDPLGTSTLVDLTESVAPSAYDFVQVKLLLAVLHAVTGWQERVRLEMRLTHAELAEKVAWAKGELQKYDLATNREYLSLLGSDDEFAQPALQTFQPFASPSFSMRRSLHAFHSCLTQAGYTRPAICKALGVESLQVIESTYFHYYDRFSLPHSSLGDFIRLFLLRGALAQSRLVELFGETLFHKLVSIGLLIERFKAANADRTAAPSASSESSERCWASRVDIFCVEGLYIATDHRYMFFKEDRTGEDPVMYLGADSMGLVYTAPQYLSDQVLDLCCGSGVQGLVASRYAEQVTAVDINPRAIRFARFNAQLNGVLNIQFHLGSLYAPVEDLTFDTILANPPFVPSPSDELRFRDGGNTGEDILAAIIQGSAQHLTPKGRLFIVTDLVNVPAYDTKLANWWTGGHSHQLLLCTADRDEMLFSVPHSHAPFGQSYEDYTSELNAWLTNFQSAALEAVNFGYILIQRTADAPESSYYVRTIHNPTQPIYEQVKDYFWQRDLLCGQAYLTKYLILNPDLQFRIEETLTGDTKAIELFSPDNPYFTTYQINPEVHRLLKEISYLRPEWQKITTPTNQAWIKELLHKGILSLQAKSTGPNEAKGITNNHSKSMAKSSQKDSALGIVELRTKTTPTCLSAYLTQ
ncbi:MAG: carbamoyltransferase C-terminal domain-containing protein [Cyanobacteria bacterium J06627_28]